MYMYVLTVHFSSVTLSVIGDGEICPSMPVTVRCVVKKIPSSVFFLSWRCNKEKGEENLVLCHPILDFSCEFGEVVNVTGSCECDNSVIVSEATFVSKSDGPDTGSLTCSNGREEETVSVTANGERYICIIAHVQLFHLYLILSTYCVQLF